MFRALIYNLLNSGLPFTLIFIAVVAVALLSEPLFHDEEE